MKRLLPWIALLISYCCSLHAQEPFKAVSAFDANAIQGRPVQLDATGKLLPWPWPDDVGASYQSYFMTQWSYLLQQYHGPRYYYFHCCVDFDRSTFKTIPDRHWANSTGYLRAMLEGFVEHLYPYTGDAETIQLLEDAVDYELVHGTTPRDYAWSGVPYASADPGAANYRGWSQHAVDFIEPPIVGEDGYGYLRLYEMTGEARYLEAAKRCADALVKNIRAGDATHSPWPVRVDARSGRVRGKAMGEYSANVIEPIALLDEMIRLQFGDVVGYRGAREQAWQWLRRYPMKNNVWVGYFEDVAPTMGNMNNVIPLETARYVLLHPDKDVEWKNDAAKLIDWVKTTPRWPKYIVHGATVTTEQGDGKNFCCGKPNVCCDSHTARLAAVEAIFYWKTGDEKYRDAAYRSYNWVTYQQGFPPLGTTPWGQGQWWFTDEFSDGPRRMMDGLWAVPAWAPGDASHFLGTTSVVTRIAYGRGSVTYATFDEAGDDVLKLDFTPTTVWMDGHEVMDGYKFDRQTHVLRVHRTAARQVSISGDGGKLPVKTVTFDNPQLAVGMTLDATYPTGVISWNHGDWKVGAPRGRFSTFNLGVAQCDAHQAGFSFIAPRVLTALSIFNDNGSDRTVILHSAPNADVMMAIPAGQLRRVSTQWRTPTTSVVLDASPDDALGGLFIDDVSYDESTTVPAPALQH
ncbi:hypothetical protein [Rhodanobacter sp. L36]|uniref:hypothetical protein n=1 Tax=Rhodanobacter sp. L36 TaxID=1747221 RepID=UPI00131E7423|nr:hypothetical protein [Rhodanobacter sp. L36]